MIVTLSGSTRFEQDFINAQRELSKRGVLYFSLAVLPQNREQGEDWSDESITKVMADLLYFYRIQNSDAVLVLGDGYIGQSTAREILWADIQSRPLYRQRPVNLVTDWDKIVERLFDQHDDRADLVQKAREVFGG